MKENCIFQITCIFCNNKKSSKRPFFSDLKENNKRYIICNKCNKKVFFQDIICNGKIDKKNLPINPDLSKIKTR